MYKHYEGKPKVHKNKIKNRNVSKKTEKCRKLENITKTR